LDTGTLDREEAAREATAFLALLGQTQADFRRLHFELAAWYTALRAEEERLADVPTSAARREEIEAERERARLSYHSEKDALVADRFHCLGSEEELRRLGILTFSYAWD
jgi:hypothetical protein